MDESIVSFLCNIYFSYFGPDTLVPSHTAVGVCVDMKTGEILNLLSFAGDEKDAARQQLIEIVQRNQRPDSMRAIRSQRSSCSS